MKLIYRIYPISILAVFGFCLFLNPAVSAQPKSTSTPKIRTEMLATTDWLSKHITDKNVFVLHVARDRKTFEAGHIPGARFVSLTDLLATREGITNELPPVQQLQKLFENTGIGDQGKIVIYGENNGLAAARAFFTLDYLGHGNRAALLDGGMEKWKAEKRPVETRTVTFQSAKFTPRLQPDVVAKLDAMRDLSWIATNVSGADISIIDARPEEQYVGAPNVSAANQRGGHIPGATNVFWMTQLTSANDLTLKPPTELQKLFSQAGLKPSQKVVTYCNTGMQASYSYFTLKYLGYDVKMYDGSFSEWSKADNAPVVNGKEKK